MSKRKTRKELVQEIEHLRREIFGLNNCAEKQREAFERQIYFAKKSATKQEAEFFAKEIADEIHRQDRDYIIMLEAEIKRLKESAPCS